MEIVLITTIRIKILVDIADNNNYSECHQVVSLYLVVLFILKSCERRNFYFLLQLFYIIKKWSLKLGALVQYITRELGTLHNKYSHLLKPITHTRSMSVICVERHSSPFWTWKRKKVIKIGDKALLKLKILTNSYKNLCYRHQI